MKVHICFLAMVMFLAFSSCEEEDFVNELAPSSAISAVGVNGNGATSSTADVISVASGKAVGTSELVRNNNGVSFSLKTSELEPANPYTLWLVVFNNPEEYRDGCDGSKFGPHFNEEIQLDVLL